MRLDPLTGKSLDAVRSSTAAINVYEGSVRSGKTIGSLLAWIDFVLQAPPGDLVMVGKTERTLKRNIVGPLRKILGPDRCRHVAGEGELYICGRLIYLVGAANEEAVGKIQGMGLIGAYVDETALLPESFWLMLLTRMSEPGARVFATSNPDSPMHWLMRDFLSKARLWIQHDGTTIRADPDDDSVIDLHRFSFNLDDNPALPADYVTGLKRMFTGLWYKRFIQGLWVIADGVIWDTWNETRHVTDRPPDGVDMRDYIVAIDYGTAGVFAALLLGRGSDDRIWILDEWRWDARAQRRQLTDVEYSQRLRNWLDELDPNTNALPSIYPGARTPSHIHVDPSASSFIAQLHRDRWSHVRLADNAVADGIRNVSSLLAADRIVALEQCEGLRREIPGYMWDPKAQKLGVDKPVKADDHSCDALRYGIQGARRWWRHWLADVTLDDAA